MRRSYQIFLPSLILLFFAFHPGNGQQVINSKLGKGVTVVAKDSSFSLQFRGRFQTLYNGQLNLDTDEHTNEMQIRRARIKFDGFAYSPRLIYKVELAISNADMSGGDIPQSSNTSRLVLDAVLKYNFYKNWWLWFGQTKLPGNIERVISSQLLQLVDRSNLNARFNIDRDAGFQLRYEVDKVRLISCISGGEGRNITEENSGGFDYTLRGEWLPFGPFEGDEYSGADLEREPQPKLFLGLTYDYNDRAAREGGQLGEFMPENRTLLSWFADAHFKYHGFSTMIEYAHRSAPEGPAIYDTNDELLAAYYTGWGLNMQSGYLFKNNIEVAGRYTHVSPEEITERNESNQYTLGISRYFVGHNLKIQSDISLLQEDTRADTFMYRFQVELAF